MGTILSIITGDLGGDIAVWVGIATTVVSTVCVLIKKFGSAIADAIKEIKQAIKGGKQRK